MNRDHLSQIENSLRRLYEQLANKERILVTIAPEEKERIRHQIQDFRQTEIQPLEEEHRQILAAASEQLEISEPEAAAIVGEIVEGVTQLEAQPVSSDVAQILSLLQEIRDKVNEPDKPAALRLKGMISTFPPFVGVFIEPEIDTENFWQRYFPTFRKLLKSAVKK